MYEKVFVMQGMVTAVCLVAVGYVVVSKYSRKRRRRFAVSVPEALRVLTHGPFELRGLAAEALCGIVYGEVTIIEEILDEIKRKHIEYCPARSDGFTLVEIAFDDMLQRRSIHAARLLLLCTKKDPEWPDDDEWNTFVADFIVVLAASCTRDKKDKLMRLASPTSHEFIPKAAFVLSQRIFQNARATSHDLDTPLKSSLDVLPFNTRFCCAECGQSLRLDPKEPRCTLCNNVAYCSEAHARADKDRHAFWCCSSSSSPSLRCTF